MILFTNPVTGPDGEQYFADQGMLAILRDYYLTSDDKTVREAFIEGVKCGRIWPVLGSTALSRAVMPAMVFEDEDDCD